MQTVKTLLYFLAISIGLAGCGLKGPLYIAPEEPVAEAETPEVAEDNDESSEKEKKKKTDRN